MAGVYAAKVGGTGLLINLVGVVVYWRAKRREASRAQTPFAD